MRVETKYGKGTLLGITTNETDTRFGYKVLLDNEYPTDVPDDEKQFNMIRECKDRLYHCNSIKVLSDDGHIIKLSNKIELIDNIDKKNIV